MSSVPTSSVLLPPGFELSDSGKVAYYPRWMPAAEARSYIAARLHGFPLMTSVDLGGGRAAVVLPIREGGYAEAYFTAAKYREWRRLRAINALADGLYDAFIGPAIRKAGAGRPAAKGGVAS